MPQPFSVLIVFQTRSCIFALGQPWTEILLPMPLCSWGSRHVPTCLALKQTFLAFQKNISITVLDYR
jgi:hypothetical protein